MSAAAGSWLQCSTRGAGPRHSPAPASLAVHTCMLVLHNNISDKQLPAALSHTSATSPPLQAGAAKRMSVAAAG